MSSALVVSLRPRVRSRLHHLTWNIRSADFAADDMCNASGQKMPFRTTTAERVAKRDPRPSLQERYRSHAGHVARVTLSATNLKGDRLLLREDVLRYIAKAVTG